jgi:peptide/nickel transport system permease protein
MTNLIRRVVSTLMVIWLAASLAFFALRVLPGDAIEAQLVQSGVSQDVIEQRRAEQGLNEPIVRQYLRFVSSALRGDLGRSLLDGQLVSEIMLQQLAPTVVLALSALLLATGLGLLLGVASALDMPYGIAPAARAVTSLSLSTPIYWTGTIAIIVFSAQLDWLPSAGAGRLSQLVLPVGVLGFHTAGAIARVTQANVRETLGAEFVRTARAKGLPERIVIWRHVLRASLLPVVTVIALQAGFLFSGTVITESLFVRAGIGRVLLDAIIRQDYPVVQGVAIFTALIYVLFNMLADGLHHLLDPRVTP